ncbi:MAG: DMT family transporter [Campylobacteraceae bacterium]|nr:DMT family transporter [Campylobacteraceae bacterium]
MNTLVDNKFFILCCLLTVVILWSMNFVFIKFVLNEFDVFTALFFRMSLVAILLIPFVKKPQKSEYIILGITTVVLVPGHYGLLFLALMQTTSVGSISVVIQLSIPFSVLLAWFFYKDYPGFLRLTGLFIAFAGIVILFYEPSMFDNLGALTMGTLSALFLGLYSILVKKIKKLSSLGIIAYTSLLGIPFLYALSIFNGESLSDVFEIESKLAWGSFLFTVIGSSIMGHGLWAWLVKHQSISLITPFLLLVPILAVALSAVFLNEIITFEFLLTSGIIIFGIFLVFMAKKTPSLSKEEI